METLTQIAQRSFENLLNNREVSPEGLALLNDETQRFALIKSGIEAVFAGRSYTVEAGAGSPGVYVGVHAHTSDGPKTITLNMPQGQPDFEVVCLSEVPDAAGPV